MDTEAPKMLLVTPRPHGRESFLGHLLRASEANGYPTPTYILTIAGLDEEERRRCHLPLEKVAPVLNRLPGEFATSAWTPSSESGHDTATLRGNTFLAKSLCLQHPKICPDCVDHLGFVKSSWDLNALVGCAKHGKYLLWKCPGCGSRLDWRRQGLLACKCGADLKTQTENMPPEVLPFLEYLERRFYGDPIPTDLTRLNLPVEMLEGLSLQALVSLVEILGKCAQGYTGRNRNKGESVDPGWYQRVITTGGAALSDWPNNFYKLLNNVVAQSELDDDGVNELITILFKNSSSKDEYLPIRCAITQYERLNHRILDRRVMNAVDMPVEDRNLVSLRQYSEITGEDVRALRKAIEAGILKAEKRVLFNAVRYLVDLRQAPVYLVKGTDASLNLRQTSKYLGLPECVIRSLVETKCLVRRHVPVPVSCFRIEDLDAFRAAVFSHAPILSVGEYDPSTHLLLSDKRLKRVGSSCSKAALIEAILKKEIQPVGRQGDGILDMVLRIEDVPAINQLNALRVESSTRQKRHIKKSHEAESVTAEAGALKADKSGLISKAVAAKLIGCKSSTLQELIDTGHLVCVGSKMGFRIQAKSVEAFLSAYVSARVHCRQLGISLAALRKLCTEQNIQVFYVFSDKSSYPELFLPLT